MKLPRILFLLLASSVALFLFSSSHLLVNAAPSPDTNQGGGFNHDYFQNYSGLGYAGVVKAIKYQSDNRALVGGDFTYFSPAQPYLVRLNPTGRYDDTFNKTLNLNGAVNVMAVFPDDKILISGTFTSVDGQVVNKFAKLDKNGHLDQTFTVGAGFNGTVNVITIDADGKILVGGEFTEFDGNSIKNLARLENNGSFDSSFNVGLGPNAAVYAIAVQNTGQILIGGAFTAYDVWDINHFLRINSDGSRDAFYYNALGTGFNGNVYAIASETNNYAYVGGSFSDVNGASYNNLAVIDNNGWVSYSFSNGTGPNGTVRGVYLVPNSKVILYGDFTQINGIDFKYFGRIINNGTRDQYFVEGSGIASDTPISAFGLQQDLRKILIGLQSTETTYNGNPVNLFFSVLNIGFHQIKGLGDSADVVAPYGSIKAGSSAGSLSPTQQIDLKANGVIVASVVVDFSGSNDLTWNTVSFDTDINSGKTVVANLNPNNAPGASSNHTLYIPRLAGQDGVFICPNAAQLTDVTFACTGGYSLVDG